MNKTAKRRLIVVSGIIVIVLIVVLAVVGSANNAKATTVAEIAGGGMENQKVQVSGKVVQDSFSMDNGVLNFSIYDEEGGEDTQVKVRYEGSASSTFGNNVTAICTGRVDSDGVVHASELVTKCPSKYENASEALGVSELLGYGDSVVGSPVKVTGKVAQGTLTAAGEADIRFVLEDASDGTQLPVRFADALGDDVAEGSELVVLGTLTEAGEDGVLEATEVSLAE